MFLIVGILMVASSLLFMWTKSQTLYFIILSALMLVAIAWVAFFAPESPHFLLSKEKYEELGESFARVCKMNNCYDEIKIKKVVQKLKQANEEEQERKTTVIQDSKSSATSLFRNKINFHNLIAVCYIWASSGFITYLLTYYSKYFQGNFFLNFSISGLSDGFSMMWIGLLSMKFEMKGLVAFCNMLIIGLSVALYFVM